jgi:hypothetical protein
MKKFSLNLIGISRHFEKCYLSRTESKSIRNKFLHWLMQKSPIEIMPMGISQIIQTVIDSVGRSVRRGCCDFTAHKNTHWRTGLNAAMSGPRRGSANIPMFSSSIEPVPIVCSLTGVTF